jgi:hypothetical protein
MELGNNNYEDNFTKSKVFTEKIKELDSGIDVLLDKFKKLYVIVNMHPANQEYQQQYQTVVSNLSSVLSKMFSVSKEIQVNVDDINKKLLEYDVLIREEKKKNSELKVKLGIVEDKNNAASEMITDYKDIYDKRYLRNWSLILSSIIGLLAIGTVYKKPQVV